MSTGRKWRVWFAETSASKLSQTVIKDRGIKDVSICVKKESEGAGCVTHFIIHLYKNTCLKETELHIEKHSAILSYLYFT